MKLEDLAGNHILTGIDHTCGEVLFQIDGLNYLIIEDEDDGYRSYMSELEITDRTIKNIFCGQPVRCEHQGEESDILRIYSSDNKIILEVGTDYTDDYYPCAVFNYYPENMDINQNNK